MPSLRDPRPAIFQIGSPHGNEGNAGIVRLRDDRLELCDLGRTTWKALRVYVPALIVILLAASQDDEGLFVLAFLVLFGGLYVHRSAVLSDVEDAIESTPEAELFADATQIELGEVSNVRRGGSLQTSSYAQVSFEYNGLEYSVLGSDELAAGLLDAFGDAGGPAADDRNRDRPDDGPDPTISDDRTVGDRPASAKSPRPKGGSDRL